MREPAKELQLEFPIYDHRATIAFVCLLLWNIANNSTGLPGHGRPGHSKSKVHHILNEKLAHVFRSRNLLHLYHINSGLNKTLQHEHQSEYQNRIPYPRMC